MNPSGPGRRRTVPSTPRAGRGDPSPRTILYVDCFSGISGDMVLGALVDLGVPLGVIAGGLRGLPIAGYALDAERSRRGGIRGTRVIVSVRKGPHEERPHAEIVRLIRRGSLPERVKQRSLAIFRELARAESRVHGVPVSRVEFHEVGGVDTIVDIVGACLALEYLGVRRVSASAIPWSGGWVGSLAGPLPLPAPAVAELLKGVPVIPSPHGERHRAELVTPTGMAILRGLGGSFGRVPSMTVTSVGYGAGSRDHGYPNLLRVVLGTEERGGDGVVVLEANIDDMNPQYYEPLMEDLLRAGALDVFLTPIHMKKGRPAILLSVLAREEEKDRIAGVVFSESTTIGLRWHPVSRLTLERMHVTLKMRGGRVRAKVSSGPWGETVTPEYEDLRSLSRRVGRSMKDLHREAVAAYQRAAGHDRNGKRKDPSGR